jgi:hypothetical protein
MKKTLNEIVSDQELRSNLERRFTPKVAQKSPDECWPWTARAVTSFGYGRMTAGRGTHLKSHRIAYALAFGGIPDGLHVLHRCDNPKCCNPGHLFLGRHKDNVDDMRAKKRAANPPSKFGEKHHNTRFSEADALKIISDPRPARLVAPEYGVCEATIWRIRRGDTWKAMPRRSI